MQTHSANVVEALAVALALRKVKKGKTVTVETCGVSGTWIQHFELAIFDRFVSYSQRVEFDLGRRYGMVF